MKSFVLLFILSAPLLLTGCEDTGAVEDISEITPTPDRTIRYGVPEGQEAVPPVEGYYAESDYEAIQTASTEAAALFFAVETRIDEATSLAIAARDLMPKTDASDWDVELPNYVVEQIVAQSVLWRAMNSPVSDLPADDLLRYTERLVQNRTPAPGLIHEAIERLGSTVNPESLETLAQSASRAYDEYQTRVQACEKCQEARLRVEESSAVQARTWQLRDRSDREAASALKVYTIE